MSAAPASALDGPIQDAREALDSAVDDLFGLEAEERRLTLALELLRRRQTYIAHEVVLSGLEGSNERQREADLAEKLAMLPEYRDNVNQEIELMEKLNDVSVRAAHADRVYRALVALLHSHGARR